MAWPLLFCSQWDQFATFPAEILHWRQRNGGWVCNRNWMQPMKGNWVWMLFWVLLFKEERGSFVNCSPMNLLISGSNLILASSAQSLSILYLVNGFMVYGPKRYKWLALKQDWCGKILSTYLPTLIQSSTGLLTPWYEEISRKMKRLELRWFCQNWNVV